MQKYVSTKIAAFLTIASTAACSFISPLLFTTFNSAYGISYTKLGFLVVLNFGTQLLFDLIYSFFSNKLNLKVSVKLTPVLMFLGLFIYAASPHIFGKHIYLGLCISTVIFSAGSGLSEVLTSPLIAAIPSKNPERLMSSLHSFYAWGVVGVVGVSTLFIHLFTSQKWQILTLILAILPLVASVFMLLSPIPDLEGEGDGRRSQNPLKNKTAVLYILCIFFAGASEITMSQWCSGYLETVFGIDKAVGDFLGLTLFGAALGLGRTLYAKFGKNIDRVLILGSLGALVCYVLAAFSPFPAVAVFACALTGFCVSMLWPGSLIAVTDKVKGAGVSLFALMAVGGDLGATLWPQAVGFITDNAEKIYTKLYPMQSFAPQSETYAMRYGMIFGIIAPICAVILFTIASKIKRERT